MKRSIFKRCLAFIALSVLCLSICACSNQNNEIKTLTNRFEKSCNKIDLNAMLDCIDPDISNSIKTVTGIIGLFSKNDTDEILDKFAGLLFRELPKNSKEFFSSIKIKLGDIEKDENKAFASAKIEYNISGEAKETNASFEYICVGDKWYISDFNIE